MKTNVLIVGAGLSGLWLAWQLEQLGYDYRLVEARDRLGGRIHSYVLDTVHCDIGPSWFWPGQERIKQLINQLGLDVFEQYSDGELLYEDEHGRVQKGHGYASMRGSCRVKGSLSALIDALGKKIPKHRLRLNCRVRHIAFDASGVQTKISNCNSMANNKPITEEAHEIFDSKHVVLAIPPRVAAQTIQYDPALLSDETQAMKKIPTWMAGQAKVLAFYDKPFWREAGLSGDVMSRRGPLVEIHDASPSVGGPYALFGFVGVPPIGRASQRQAILDAALYQLSQLFGEQAKSPIDVVLQDWAFETETSISLDHVSLTHHPIYGLPKCLSNINGGHLILSSTEVAKEFGGYLEGALEAAEVTLKKLTLSNV